MRRGAYDKQLCSLPPSAPFNERFPHLVGRKEQGEGSPPQISDL